MLVDRMVSHSQTRSSCWSTFGLPAGWLTIAVCCVPSRCCCSIASTLTATQFIIANLATLPLSLSQAHTVVYHLLSCATRPH